MQKVRNFTYSKHVQNLFEVYKTINDLVYFNFYYLIIIVTFYFLVKKIFCEIKYI